MLRFRLFTIVPLSLIVLGGCNPPSTFTNFSFENGSLSEWKSVGTSFSVSSLETYENNTRYYLPDGQYHVLGGKEETGSLTSQFFTLKASGYISLLISNGEVEDQTYVGIYSSKNEELIRIYNHYYNSPYQTETYVRFNLDLSSYLDETVYVKVVDESLTSSINFDGLVTEIAEEDLPHYLDDTNVRLGIARASDMREAANLYTKLNSWKVNKENRYGFHLSAPIGWINDPNGFSYFNGKTHLFYQHNPYATRWGPMHWGHAVTEDFVTWTHQPVALAPDQNYDTVGAFSGSAIELDNQFYLLYTGASENGQVQALATSSDGVIFEKDVTNPVIGASHLPANTSIQDFRDPKLFIRGEWIYAIVSARNIANPYSSLLLYKTKNMKTWQYAGRAFSNSAQYINVLGIMMECPDLVTIDNQDMIIVSPQSVANHRNSDGNVYIKGTMNWTTGVLENVHYNEIKEIDNGFDFYAPTTLKYPDGRTIMVAWMGGWSRSPVTAEFGYAGAMTFPRELSFLNGQLVQTPVSEITNYHNNYVELTSDISTKTYVSTLNGRSKDMTIEFSPNMGKTGLTVFDDGEGQSVSVYYQDGRVYLDRSTINQGYFPSEAKHNLTSVETPLVDGKVKIRLLLDKYSVEVFTADGLGAMTSTVMTNQNHQQVSLFADSETSMLIKAYDMVI